MAKIKNKKEFVTEGIKIRLDTEELIVDKKNAKIALGCDPEKHQASAYLKQEDGTYAIELSDILLIGKKYKITIEELD